MANRVIPSTGSPIQATLIIGRVSPLEQVTDTFDRPGIDGHGMRLVGMRAPLSALRLLKAESSYANARSAELSLRSLVSLVCEIEYEVAGQSETGVYLQSVTATAQSGEAIIASLDQSGNLFMLDMTLLVRKVV